MKSFSIMKIAFLDDLSYRSGTIVRYLSGFFFDYVKVSVWYALVTYESARVSPSTVNATVQYMILAAAISAFYAANDRLMITRDFKNGNISKKMLLPVNLLKNAFCQTTGKVFAILFTNIVPTLILLSLVFKPSWKINVSNIPWVIAMLVTGIIVNWMMIVQIDLLCFWLTETATLQNMRIIIYKFFSGTLMPLWFFPQQISEIINILPFSKMIYYPVAFLLNEIPKKLFMLNFLTLIIWALIFMVALTITWKCALRKIEVMGG